jgi:tetratricopeptide (TPR) repeat protein
MRDALAKLMFFLATLVFLFLVWLFFFAFLRADNLERLLPQVDMAISLSDFGRARSRLRNIKRYGLSEHDRMRILDRSWQLSLLIGNYGLVEKEAYNAARAFPHQESFWAFYIYTLLQKKEYERASRLAREHLHSAEFRALRHQAILSALNAGASNPLVAASKRLEVSTSPEYFEEMGRELQSPILFYNAAILWMTQGNTTRANALTPWFSSPQVPILHQAVMAYDLENYSLSLQLLTEDDLFPSSINGNTPAQDDIIQSLLFSRSLLLADIHLKMNQLHLALEFYRQAISLMPDASWHAWLNTVLLFEKLEHNRHIQPILRDALLLFPEQSELIVAFNEREIDTVLADNNLRQFIDAHPLNVPVYLYWLNSFGIKNQVAESSTRLWNLFNSNSDSAQLTKYMVWFFLGQNNFDDALLVLKRFKGSDTQWLSSYQALTYALKGDREIALNLFSQTHLSWENNFNQALIEMQLGQNESALQHLLSAITIYRELNISQHNSQTFAHMYTQLAQVYIMLDRHQLARSAAEEALSLDEKNTAARQILHQLSI